MYIVPSCDLKICGAVLKVMQKVKKMNNINQEMESISSKHWRMGKSSGPRPLRFVSTSTPAPNLRDSGYFDSQELHQSTFGSVKNAHVYYFNESGEIPDKASLSGISHSVSSLDCVDQQQQHVCSFINSRFFTPSITQCSDSLLRDVSTPSIDSMLCRSGDPKNSVPYCISSVSGDSHLKERSSFLMGESSVSVGYKSSINSSLHSPEIPRSSEISPSQKHFNKEMKNILDSLNSSSIFTADADTLTTCYGLRKRGLDSSSNLLLNEGAVELHEEQRRSACGIKEDTQEKAESFVHPSTSKFSKLRRALDKSRLGKIGSKHIDFIKELFKKNCKNVLKTLFSFLTPKELCRISWVSRQWRTAVTSDRSANQRREAFLKFKKKIRTGPNKENSMSHKRSPLGSNREVLANTQNIINQPSRTSQNVARTPSTPKSRFQNFIEEAKGLKENERIQKCPRCVSPCKVSLLENRGQCSTPSCSYEFCIKCFFRYHKSPRCPALISGTTPKMPIVSSRRSKKNLRRL